MAQSSSLDPSAGWMYDLVYNTFAPSIDIFFREVQVRGARRVPSSGGIILVAAPHANQFVDSLVLMRCMKALNRRVSWLMAEKSFDKPIIGPLARLIGVVPVSRAMDNMKAADGTICLLEPNGDHRLLQGTGTQFDGPGFEVGGSIYLPAIDGESQKLDIAEISGPDRIMLKSVPESQTILDQLSIPGGTRFKVAPHVNQSHVYNAVFERLRQDECIGIFPEGGSHDRTSLLPLKAGIAIMALGSLAQGTQVTVVPVGMNYFHPHKFRSRAVVEFGDPITIGPELVSSFKSGKRRESVAALLSSITQSLAAVTVSAPDFETMILVHAARRLYISKRKPLPLSTIIEINRRLVKGYTQYKFDPRIQKVAASIIQYSQRLRLLGLRDHQVDYARFSTLYVLSSLISRILKLCLLSIGTIPGLVLFAPIFLAARIYSHRKTAEALAASTVKVRGNDVMATWKILVAALLAPLLYTFYAVIIALWTRYNHLNGLVSATLSTWVVVAAVYVLFPLITYAALRLGETGMDILKSLRPLVLCLLPSSAGTLAQLREQKMVLTRDVTELIDTLGPDLFPDCESAKLPFPRKLYTDVSPNEMLDDLMDTEFFSVAA